MPSQTSKPTITYSSLNHTSDDSSTTPSPANKMSIFSTSLYLAISLLMIDAIIELSFISSMVSWLHRTAGGEFVVNYGSSQFNLHGKPAGLLVDQGHTSNGAAGTAFVLVGMGGTLALWLRSHAAKRPGKTTSVIAMAWYHCWLVLTILSVLLSLGALAYTFILTTKYAGQSIDVEYASTLHSEHYPNYVAYARDFWTPENWFSAILRLDLASDSLRNDIGSHLTIMRAWRWNLIALSMLGVVVAVLALLDALASRRQMRSQIAGYELVRKSVSS